jgi:glycosyltransferase involved in cell wall biosynthesis
MRFSVIVPVYNSEGFISRCVDSILAAGLPAGDFEIILVNDGSTDGSRVVCEALAGTYPCIKLINQDNKGVSVARNRGIEVAIGEYISFVDSDDYLVPDGFSGLLTYCDGNNDLIRFYGSSVVSGDRAISRQGNGEVTFQGKGREFISRFGMEFFCWNYLYKKDFLNSNNLRFLPRSYAEDFDFMFRVMMADPMIISLSEYVYQYVIRPNSISTDRSLVHSRLFARDFASILIRIASLLKDSKDTDPILYHTCRKSLEASMVTLFSRILSSDYSKKEFKTLLDSLQVVGLLPFETSSSNRQEQTNRTAISILSRFPGIFPLARWIFRHFFLPVIYPRLLRKVICS